MRFFFLQSVLKVCVRQYTIHPFRRCIYRILFEKLGYQLINIGGFFCEEDM